MSKNGDYIKRFHIELTGQANYQERVEKAQGVVRGIANDFYKEPMLHAVLNASAQKVPAILHSVAGQIRQLRTATTSLSGSILQ